MFRKLVKTGDRESTAAAYAAQYFEQKTARGGAALQLRGDARAGGSHHPGRRLDDQPGVEGGAAGAGDDLQPAAGGAPASSRGLSAAVTEEQIGPLARRAGSGASGPTAPSAALTSAAGPRPSAASRSAP